MSCTGTLPAADGNPGSWDSIFEGFWTSASNVDALDDDRSFEFSEHNGHLRERAGSRAERMIRYPEGETATDIAGFMVTGRR